MSSIQTRAKAIFLAALARPAAERQAFLEHAYEGDADLRQQVESLLAFHEDKEAGEASGPVKRATERFAPGEIFAGRYRMITRLGRGGMGDVWRADDLVLQSPVALKLIHSTSPEGRTLILNEVRLARQVTHPAVCRVFDVGEAEGEIFFSMELVRGEDLHVLLKRVGRLPSDKVIEIGRHLCAGLAAAHAQGVLHRDLKPANVLIDENGLVRITDFGIAITRNATGDQRLIGTPGYMAPEQLVPGTPLSERTDVYALGLLLYELVAGQRPFDQSGNTSLPKPLAMLVPGIDPQLQSVILKALSPDPVDRPQSALAMAASLPEIASRSPRGRSLWLAGGAVAAAAVLAAVVSPLFLPRVNPGLTGQDTIVLADFVNTTGEPVFDGALKVALTVGLEQSPFLKVFPEERIRETLRLMDRPPDAHLTRSIAREVAQREQLKALVSASVAGLGRNYVLTIEAIDTQTGDVMAREQIEVASKEQVLTSLGGAVSRLREKLGESLASIKKFDVPLPRATTPSLDALHAYARALDQGRSVLRLDAIPHLRRAIELDPNFAMAHALLSGVYANTGQSALAPQFSRRAFALRDRVSERERFFISWRYFHDATQEWDKALELAKSWTTTYPREAFAFNSLGIASYAFGQYEQAIAPLWEAIRLDPKFRSPYGNLGSVLIALDRFDDAGKILEQPGARGVAFTSFRRVGYVVAFVAGDSVKMARELGDALRIPEGMSAAGWQPRTSRFEGRLRSAHDQVRRGIQLAIQRDFKELAAQWTIEDAEFDAMLGQCAETRAEVSVGLGFSRDNATLERASRTLALCGESVEASKLSDELSKRFPDATLTNRIMLPVTNAALAIHRGEARRALEVLEPVRPYDHSPVAEFWPAYLRGQAHLRLKDGRAAGIQFQSIVDHRGEAADSPLYPLAHLGLARAATLTGESDRARKAYEDFLALWSGADPDLQPLQEARREFSRLAN